MTQLVETIAKLNERVGELLAVAQRKHRKPPAPKPAEQPPTVEGDAKLAFETRPTHLPVEEHSLRPDACGHCGGMALDAADVVVDEKLHVVKEHQRRRVVKRTACRCRDCGKRTTPRSLPAPYERSKVTCDWLAWLVATKFSMLTPLDRTRRALKERGITMAMGSLVAFIERAADLLAPIDRLHWQQLLASAWMATDGTGLKVLVPGLPAAHDGYLELYRNLSCAVFQYEATAVGYYQRHKKALFRFIDDASVPIDNSATEREFQHVAKLRLNALFAGSTEGAHRACVLLGIIATCRTVGVPVQAYLTWAFERLGTHRDVFGLPLEEMMPAAFKKTLG